MKAEYIVLALFAVFAWYELRDSAPAIATGTTTPNVNNPLSNIDAGGSATIGQTSQTTGTTLSQSQTGGGLFGNPTGLGSNPTSPSPPLPIVSAPIFPGALPRIAVVNPPLGKPAGYCTSGGSVCYN